VSVRDDKKALKIGVTAVLFPANGWPKDNGRDREGQILGRDYVGYSKARDNRVEWSGNTFTLFLKRESSV